MRRLVHLSSLVALLVALEASAADEFYLIRLRSGEEAYRAKQFAQAADELRIACFGLMEQPPLLIQGLVELALAQQAAGRPLEVQATLTRFVEVERRFPAYASANLDKDQRADFEALIQKRLPAQVLGDLPSLSRPVESPDSKLSKLPAADRRKALEALVAKEPRNVAWPLWLARDAWEAGDAKSTIDWAGKVVDLEPGNELALRLRGQARTSRREFKAALADLDRLGPDRLVETPALYGDLLVCRVGLKEWDAARLLVDRVPAETRARRDVAEALARIPPVSVAVAPTPTPTPAPSSPSPAPAAALSDLLDSSRKLQAEGKSADAVKALTSALKTYPESRELRKTLLEAACLSKDWKTAAQQAKLLDPLAEGEEALMFYSAVALYETGSVEQSRKLMARARPKIASSAFVEYYARKILGGS